jgi:integral membrane sensor domain MASE1
MGMSKMGKKIVLKGARIGAIVGYIAAMLLVWSFSLLDPTYFSINNTLVLSSVAALIAALIGAITGVILGILFQKFNSDKNLYTFVCVSLSMLAVISSLGLIMSSDWKYFSKVPQPDSDSLVYAGFLILCAGPGILYSFLTFFVSRYLFNQFKRIELAYQVPSE